MVRNESLERIGLTSTTITVKTDFDTNVAESKICNVDGDAMAFKEIEYFFEQVSRKRDVMRQVRQSGDQ